MVALVHERQYADRVANVLPDTPNVKTILVIEDGSDLDFQRYGGVEFYSAIAQGSPERDFGPRSADDIYLLYTGGTTGFPKGVMWRHEDIYRVLFGGTDFATGEPIKDEHDLAKAAAANPPMIRYAIPPMIHGATQSATWMSLFSGQTSVLAPEFNADAVWRAIHEHKVNLLFFTGDAMARPLLDALLASQDWAGRRSVRPVVAVPVGQHRRAVLAEHQGEAARAAAQPGDHRLDRLLRDRLRRHQHRRQGRGAHRRPARHHRQDHRGARRRRKRGGTRIGGAGHHRQARAHPGRLLQGRDQDRRDVQDHQRGPLRDPRRLRAGRGGRQRHHARPRVGVDQQRRREDLPRRGRGRAQGPPRRVRRIGGRRARPAVRPARRGGRASPRRRQADAGRAGRVRPQRDRRLQGAAQPLVRRRGEAVTGGQARLPLGQGRDRGQARRRRARETRCSEGVQT